AYDALRGFRHLHPAEPARKYLAAQPRLELCLDPLEILFRPPGFRHPGPLAGCFVQGVRQAPLFHAALHFSCPCHSLVAARSPRLDETPAGGTALVELSGMMPICSPSVLQTRCYRVCQARSRRAKDRPGNAMPELTGLNATPD